MPTTIRENIPLASYTTLRVGGCAEYFAEVQTVEELREVISWAKQQGLAVTFLGGGSNVCIADTGIQGVVVRPLFIEKEYVEAGVVFLVTFGAGIELDACIAELVQRGLWGLENLSAIPGTVGAVPIQNVGAYGVEAKDVIDSVTVYDRDTDTVYDMQNDACAFGYRDSIFKKRPKQYVVIAVTFRVTKDPQPKLSYKDVQNFFEGNVSPSIEDIREAIVHIRSTKFPDWNIVGTAGSFFKNPIISQSEYERVAAIYPDVPAYPYEHTMMKVSLGWILDHVCGVRGYTKGNVGLYAEQALVLVCTQEASAHEIEIFAQEIIDDVYNKIGIRVEPEVTFLS